MLKFALKQSRLDFTKNWVMPESFLQDQEPDLDEDLLADLLRLDSEDTIDRIIHDFGDNFDLPEHFLLSLYYSSSMHVFVLVSFCSSAHCIDRSCFWPDYLHLL